MWMTQMTSALANFQTSWYLLVCSSMSTNKPIFTDTPLISLLLVDLRTLSMILRKQIVIHASILCKLVSPKPPITFKKVKYRKIKSVDTSALVNDLAESSLCNVTPGSDMDILSPRDLDTFAQNYNMTCQSPRRHSRQRLLLRNLLCYDTTRKQIKLDACAERWNVNGGRPSWIRTFSCSKEGEIM